MGQRVDGRDETAKELHHGESQVTRINLRASGSNSSGA